MIDRYLYGLPSSPPRFVIPVEIGGERRRGIFHPSELCKEDQCHRHMAYELFSAPITENKVDARMQRIFDNGHFVHARTQHYLTQAFKEAGGEFRREVGLPANDLLISGTTDGDSILYDARLRWRYLVEIKSMNKAKYTELGASPWPSHQRQVNIYMGLSGVKAASILVECKDNQDVREYFVRFDQKMWDESRGVASKILGLAKKGELPPQITKEQGCEGKQCKFYDICKGTKAGWKPPGPLVPLRKK